MGSSPSRPDGLKEEKMRKVQNYLKEVVVELKKVIWPSWDELKQSTFIVLAFSLLASFYIFAADSVLIRVIEVVTNLIGVI